MLAFGSLSQEVSSPNCQSACSQRQDRKLVVTNYTGKHVLQINSNTPNQECASEEVLLLCQGLLGHRGYCEVPYSRDEACGQYVPVVVIRLH